MLEPMEDEGEPATVSRSVCTDGGAQGPLNEAVCYMRRGVLCRSRKTQRMEKRALPGRAV